MKLNIAIWTMNARIDMAENKSHAKRVTEDTNG